MTPEQAGVDLRSDTVTLPTARMRELMASAAVGDDGLDGDPTAAKLQELGATLLGKEAGLFVPSCTMANLLATTSGSARGEQIVVGATSHLFLAERGGAALTGVEYRPVPETRGRMASDLILEAVRDRRRTPLICTETSHNASGGLAPPLAYFQEIRAIADAYGCAVHLDGARIFNAATAIGVDAREIAQTADTVAVCLSKGLSAPVGALLVGSTQTVDRARLFRKMLGGQQRQVGVVAAAGIEALSSMIGRLGEDNLAARLLAQGINKLGGSVVADEPETNMVLVEVARSGVDADRWVRELAGHGVLVRSVSKSRLRCVTHRHVDTEALRRVMAAFKSVGTRIGADPRTTDAPSASAVRANAGRV